MAAAEAVAAPGPAPPPCRGRFLRDYDERSDCSFDAFFQREEEQRSTTVVALEKAEGELRKTRNYWEHEMSRRLERQMLRGEHKLSDRTLECVLATHDVEHAMPVQATGELTPAWFGYPTIPPKNAEPQADTVCVICSEHKAELTPACWSSACKEFVCRDCFTRYVKTAVDANAFTGPAISCPACHARVPTDAWLRRVGELPWAKYQTGLRALFIVSCPTCTPDDHWNAKPGDFEPRSLWVPDISIADGEARVALGQAVFGSLDLEEQEALVRAWREFDVGKRSANDMVRVLLTTFLSEEEVSRLEQPDTRLGAPPKEIAHLFLPKKKEKTDGWGVRVSEKHWTEPASKGAQLLRLVCDPERRAALLLAFLRRYPFLDRLGCPCHKPTCFKCKSPDQHPGLICEEYQFREPQNSQACPNCGVPSSGGPYSYSRSKMCLCGTYWEWDTSDEEIRYPPCWGEKTWVLLPGGAAKQLADLKVGDKVRTARGFRAVAKIWIDNISNPRTDSQVVRFRNLWVTSHHPVFVGTDWRYPAALAPAVPAKGMASVVGQMVNLELEGHEDVIVLAGDGPEPSFPLTLSCTIGKYMGPKFGFGVWTRRSTRCNTPCQQCDAVFYPGIDFGKVPQNLRWKRWEAFPQVEYEGAQATSGRVTWTVTEARAVFKDHLAAQRA
eukprot:m.17363 g.17363  ORF g.17363 m.17363 type:complete len:669 (-) comp5443_c0_seq1:45-2051(-)